MSSTVSSTGPVVQAKPAIVQQISAVTTAETSGAKDALQARPVWRLWPGAL